MNKIITSAGLVALGAASFAPGLLAQDAPKHWSIKGGLQGFYDSNSTTSSSGLEEGSFGIGLNVGAGYELPLDQTYFGVTYDYGLKWYEARESGEFDQTHIFGLRAEHEFSNNSKIGFRDTFVFSDEPTVLDSGSAVTSPVRTDSDSFKNTANLDGVFQFSEKWGVGAGYQNVWYDYKQDVNDVPAGVASRSQLLDRIQDQITLDLRYTVNPQLVALGGYQYGMTSFLSNDAYTDPNLGTVSPDWRDSSSHYLFVGGEYEVNPQLTTSLRAGAQLVTYDNLTDYAPNADDDQIVPFVDGTVTYTYNPGSYVTGGYNYGLTVTDLSVLNNKTHVAFVALTHKITSRVTGNLLYQFQYSSYNTNDNLGTDGSDIFNILGVSADYKITENLSAIASYKFDKLSSDVPNRGYDRHIVSLGVEATF